MNTRLREAISDPGGARPIAARWVVTGELVLESATQLGAGPGDAADQVLLRDAREGRPLLPGTSLAGALRSHLADVLGGYRSAEDPRVARLFGGTRGDDEGAQSPLIVFDGLATLPGGHAVEIRDGVQIDTARGTAAEHKKFDLEVLPAGTRFPLRFEIVVPEPALEEELVNLLITSLSALAGGDVSLGARRSRGLGALRATGWKALRHDLTTRHGWIDSITSDHEHPISDDVSAEDDPEAACRRAWPELNPTPCEDRRRRLVVVAEISSAGALLVRSAPTGADAPDAAHLESAGRSVLPGTSLAGVLRARALRVARVVREERADAEGWVDRLFGPRMEGVTGNQGQVLWASRLRISEAVIENGTRLRSSRVRIDRFTQGVVPGALFNEEPEHGGTVRVTFELRDPEPGEAGLLFLLLKDLLDGDLAAGGTSSVGRGVFRGTAKARLPEGTRIRLDPGSDSGEAAIDRAIREFWESPTRSEGE